MYIKFGDPKSIRAEFHFSGPKKSLKRSFKKSKKCKNDFFKKPKKCFCAATRGVYISSLKGIGKKL